MDGVGAAGSQGTDVVDDVTRAPPGGGVRRGAGRHAPKHGDDARIANNAAVCVAGELESQRVEGDPGWRVWVSDARRRGQQGDQP